MGASEKIQLKRIQDEYLNLSKGELGVPIELGKFSYNNWDKFIEYDIRFKVEFLTFPSWVGKFRYIKINGELYSHIKLKTLIVD